VIPYNKLRPVALRWGSHEELYRPLPLPLLNRPRWDRLWKSSVLILNLKKPSDGVAVIWCEEEHETKRK